MAFGVAGPWGNTVGSKPKMNLMTMVSGAGSDLATLDPTKQGSCRCTTTGSGFTINHFYISNGVNAWVDVSVATSHTHDSPTQGGTLLEILQAAGNSKLIDTAGFFMFDADVAQWVTTLTSTGAATNDTDGTTFEKSVKLATGATSGASATINVPGGVDVNFAQPGMWQSKIRIGTLSSLNCRGGVHTDSVVSADSNNVAYGLEVCTATNNNWWSRTASGTNKSVEDTTIAATVNRAGLKIIHLPTASPAKTIAYIDASTGYTKTTDIPVAGGGGHSNLFRWSIKNSTGADRPMYVYATRVRYYANTNWA
jgi:hypothetical protein